MQEKYADHIAILLVMVFFANAVFTTLRLSSVHLAWLNFGLVFIWVLAARADNNRRGHKKNKR